MRNKRFICLYVAKIVSLPQEHFAIMKEYHIKIHLKDNARMEIVTYSMQAHNQNDALKRFMQLPEYVQITSNGEILSIEVQPIERPPIVNERFVLKSIYNKTGWYVAVDIENSINIEFKKGRYNDTHRILPVRGCDFKPIDRQTMDTAILEIGEWLNDNFKELL